MNSYIAYTYREDHIPVDMTKGSGGWQNRAREIEKQEEVFLCRKVKV